MKKRKYYYMPVIIGGMALLTGGFTYSQRVPVLAADAVLAAPPYQKVLDTMDTLHLSAEKLEIEEGEIYQIDVYPAEHAAPLGWEIAEIGLNDEFVEQIGLDELKEGTKIRKFKEDGKESDIVFSGADQPAASNEKAAGLCFYLLGKKTGTVQITVNLANPTWEKAYGMTLPPLSMKLEAITVEQGTKAAREEAQKAGSENTSSENTSYGGSEQFPADMPGGTETPKPGVTPGEGDKENVNEWLDQDSLEYVYDGQTHAPVFHLPAGYSISGLTGGKNAGSYSDNVTIKDAAGNVVSTATVKYTIKPSTVVIRHLYDAVNGTVITDISGIVDTDVASIQDNSSESSLTKAGRYEVSTSIAIDESKLGNYVLEDGQTSVKKADAYHVVGNNPWFEVKMDYAINEASSQLTVNFYLKNLRTEQVGNNATNLFVLDLCIYYDENLLSYNSRSQYNNWRIDNYTPDGHKQTFTPDVSSGPVSVAPDLMVTYTGMCKGLKGDNNTTLMCSLTYDIKDGNVEALTNSVITADQINYNVKNSTSASTSDIPARYWADSSSILIRPDGSVEEHVIVIESDPVDNNSTPSETICGPDTIQEIKDRLHEYVSNNMPDKKPVTPSDELPDKAAETVAEETAENTDIKEAAPEETAGAETAEEERAETTDMNQAAPEETAEEATKEETTETTETKEAAQEETTKEEATKEEAAENKEINQAEPEEATKEETTENKEIKEAAQEETTKEEAAKEETTENKEINQAEPEETTGEDTVIE